MIISRITSIAMVLVALSSFALIAAEEKHGDKQWFDGMTIQFEQKEEKIENNNSAEQRSQYNKDRKNENDDWDDWDEMDEEEAFGNILETTWALIENVSYEVPKAGNLCNVTVTLKYDCEEKESSIEAVKLFYSVDDDAVKEIEMSEDIAAAKSAGIHKIDIFNFDGMLKYPDYSIDDWADATLAEPQKPEPVTEIDGGRDAPGGYHAGLDRLTAASRPRVYARRPIRRET